MIQSGGVGALAVEGLERGEIVGGRPLRSAGSLSLCLMALTIGSASAWALGNCRPGGRGGSAAGGAAASSGLRRSALAGAGAAVAAGLASPSVGAARPYRQASGRRSATSRPCRRCRRGSDISDGAIGRARGPCRRQAPAPERPTARPRRPRRAQETRRDPCRRSARLAATRPCGVAARRPADLGPAWQARPAATSRPPA